MGGAFRSNRNHFGGLSAGDGRSSSLRALANEKARPSPFSPNARSARDGPFIFFPFILDF